MTSGAFDDIGRVEPAAEPDFEDAGVGGGAREGEEGGGGGHFEEARLRSRRRRRALRRAAAASCVVVDQRAGDADALVEADEVRAGEGVDPVPRRFERGAEEGAGRALAVGPGDMEHRRQPVLRVGRAGRAARAMRSSPRLSAA